MPSNHLILCCPLLLPPSIFPSIKVFPNESVLCIRWPKYWNFSFSISPSNEYSGLISFRMDWLYLLAVQGTLKNLLQHHSSKASILWCSALFFPPPLIFISWRLITLQYCSSFCHTLTWITHGFTCVPHPDHLSHLPPHPIPLGLSSAPALSTCLMHPTWAGGLFHPWYYTCFNAILSEHPTLAFSHRVPKSAFVIAQISHPYMTAGKTIALTRCTFDVKVRSLLFNMLSR